MLDTIKGMFDTFKDMIRHDDWGVRAYAWLFAVTLIGQFIVMPILLVYVIATHSIQGITK